MQPVRSPCPPSTPSSQASNEHVQKPTSSLRSLAQQAAGQRGKSALQNLVARKATATPGTAPSSVSSDTKPVPGRSSLTSLAQRSTASTGPRPGGSSLANLALRSKKPSPQPSQTPAANTTLRSTESPAPAVPLTSKVAQEREGPKEQPQAEEAEPVKSEPLASIPQNPLCAPPSAAANFLFVPSRLDQCSSNHPTVNPVSLDQALYEAMRTSAHAIEVFSFDIPSPDDVVFNAQRHRSGGKLAKS